MSKYTPIVKYELEMAFGKHELPAENSLQEAFDSAEIVMEYGVWIEGVNPGVWKFVHPKEIYGAQVIAEKSI